MKKLLVIAQPSSKGFTHEILRTYKSESEKYGDEVKVIDLYKKENYQPYLAFENMKELCEDPNREKFQKKISWANEIVFIFPIWWGYMPAIMKNFIDSTFEAGFAYKFQKGKAIPKKLLKGKTAKVFATCDGYKYMYNNIFSMINIENYMKYYVLGVFGVELTDFEIYSKMRKRSDKQKQDILNSIRVDLKAEKIKFSFKDLIKKILGKK